MIELIKNILKKWGCGHKWEIHYTTEVYHPEAKPSDNPYERKRTLICTLCGKIKRINL